MTCPIEPDGAQPKDLLKVDDVCRWFAVTKDWVYDEVEAGRLPHLRLGRRTLRFDPDDLNAYLARSRGSA